MSSASTNAVGRLCWAVALLGALSGCSSVPDAVNPVSWYRGARDWVSGSDSQAQAEPTKAIPGSDKPFPNLATVPARRPETSTAAERARVARTLVADREQAHYTDEDIRRQTDDDVSRPHRPTVSSPAAAAPPDKGGSGQATAPRPAPRTDRPSSRLPRTNASAASRRSAAKPVLENEIPQVPAAPPPPPQVASAPPQAAGKAPPPRTRPEPAHSEPAHSEPAHSEPAHSAPAREEKKMAAGEHPEFGPPPADIAILQGSGRAAGKPSPLRMAPGRSPAAVSVLPRADYHGTGTRLATIYFANGSARLGKDDIAAIRRAVQAYKQRGGIITVVGHASSRTRNLSAVKHEMANFAISLDRANAVAREIVRLGVDPSAVRAVAMSDAQPAHEEAMPQGEARNRRADIMVDN